MKKIVFAKRNTDVKNSNNRIKSKLAVTSTVLIIVSLIISFIGWFLFGCYTIKGAEKEYISHSLTEENLLESAGNYDDVYFQLYTYNMFIFQSQCTLLKFNYIEENYTAQTEYISNNYRFLDEPVLDNYDSSYIISQNKFYIGDWQFRVCADGDYPKEFRTIGFNEKSKSIVYIDFDDPDLDYLCETFEPMEECFIDEYVGYNFKKN